MPEAQEAKSENQEVAEKPPAEKFRSLFHEVARASRVAGKWAVVSFVVLFFAAQFSLITPRGWGMLAVAVLLLALVGTMMALASLAGIRRHGTDGILGPAVIGLLVNGVVAVLVFVLMSTRTA